MSKSKEELNTIKEEVEAVNEKLQELTPEELAQVNGGGFLPTAAPGLKQRVVAELDGFEVDDCR